MYDSSERNYPYFYDLWVILNNENFLNLWSISISISLVIGNAENTPQHHALGESVHSLFMHFSAQSYSHVHVLCEPCHYVRPRPSLSQLPMFPLFHWTMAKTWSRAASYFRFIYFRQPNSLCAGRRNAPGPGCIFGRGGAGRAEGNLFRISGRALLHWQSGQPLATNIYRSWGKANTKTPFFENGFFSNYGGLSATMRYRGFACQWHRHPLRTTAFGVRIQLWSTFVVLAPNTYLNDFLTFYGICDF